MCAPGGCLLLEGMSALGGCLFPGGGCLLWGVSTPGGCGIPACTEADTPPIEDYYDL